METNSTKSRKTAVWLYKQPNHKTCLIDQSGNITANVFKVPIHSILFVCSYPPKKGFMKFVDTKGTVFYRRVSLAEIAETSDNFIYTSKDTIVNVSYVTQRCDWLYLWIEKYRFKISRNFKKEVIQRFESFTL